jgi:hypothetical protein
MWRDFLGSLYDTRRRASSRGLVAASRSADLPGEFSRPAMSDLRKDPTSPVALVRPPAQPAPTEAPCPGNERSPGDRLLSQEGPRPRPDRSVRVIPEAIPYPHRAVLDREGVGPMTRSISGGERVHHREPAARGDAGTMPEEQGEGA